MTVPVGAVVDELAFTVEAGPDHVTPANDGSATALVNGS